MTHRRPRAAGRRARAQQCAAGDRRPGRAARHERASCRPTSRDKVQKIGAQSNRSAGMMREFVAFARRDETSTRIDVQRAIDQALAMRRYHLSRARIDVVVDAPTEPLTIRADSHVGAAGAAQSDHQCRGSAARACRRASASCASSSPRTATRSLHRARQRPRLRRRRAETTRRSRSTRRRRKAPRASG